MKANFFIVGAPKSGTTSLSEYLSGHPKVCMALPKEPSYFCDDFPKIRLVSSESNYKSLFSRCNKKSIIIGDASTAYLMSTTAIKNINRYNPHSKIIVILRNPVDMLPSWHSQMIYSLFENETDFEKAYSLQEDRKKGAHIPKTCREVTYLLYSEIARFDDQLKRLFEVCNIERVKIILYDDFIKDTRSIYLEVLDFLGLEDDGRTSFPAANASKTARSAFINKILHTPPGWLWFLLDACKNTPAQNTLFRGHQFLKKLNTGPSQTVALNPNFIEQLKIEFRPMTEELSKIINRDLSHWY